MFENAGRKIKGLAIFNFIVWLIAGIGVGIYSKDTEVIIVGILLGGFIGWLSSILLYAFGELCENVYKIANGYESYDDSNSEETNEPSSISEDDNDSWKCPKCGTMNNNSDSFCFSCFYSKEDNTQ